MAEEARSAAAAQTIKVKAGPEAAPVDLEVALSPGDLPPWDLDSKLSVVRGRQPRVDGALKVTGRARYTQDVTLPGMLHARMLRAPIPAGEIVRIDTSKAEAMEGVRAVWTTESRSVRFAGQDVAAVAAATPAAAEDAVRAIRVEYREKPFVTELEKAMEPDAPLVYAEGEMPDPSPRKGNVLGPVASRRGGTRGDAAAGLAAAEVKVDATYRISTHTHAPLEPHGVVASWDGPELTVYASTQGIFAVREGLAEALGIDRKNVRVLTEHMGGGFGSKLGPSATGSAFAVVACKLAKQAGAPVKLMLERREEHLCTGNAPSALIRMQLGARRDGTLTAISHRSHGSAGIAGGAGTSGPATALYQGCPNVEVQDFSVFTNAGPSAPLRAPGHPQGAFALESAMDELAAKLGMDPLELRRKNESHPVRRIQLDLGAKAIGWERRSKGSGKGPRRRGIGMASGNWYVIARGEGVGAEVRIHRDGGVELLQGSQDIGTGLRTVLAMVVAEELGLRPADVKVNVGDTRYPEGPGSGGSNTTNSVAPAVRLAARAARDRLFDVAAPLLGGDPGKLEAAGGHVRVSGGAGESIAFAKAAARMPGEMLVGQAERKPQFATYSDQIAGCQFAEVEVDVETGIVRVLRMVSVNDCGFALNELTAESQVIGAMIQGVSWALLEDRTLDPMVGTMVNPNLESYKILTTADMFEATAILTDVANAGNNTSAAGLGEPPIVPTLAAVANAVFDATGARVRTLPMTPDRVLRALAEARS